MRWLFPFGAPPQTPRRAVPLAFILVVGCSHKAPAPSDAGTAEVVEAAAPIVDAGAPIVDAAPEAAAPRSLQGKKVLQVGDSMVGGTFGLTRALERKLTPEGAKIVRHTTVSESLGSFDKGSTLRDLLHDEKPDIVIITLGANDALSPYPEGYGGAVERIVKRVGDRECWWIGPPSLKTAVPTASGKTSDVALSAVIAEHAGTCHFFDSTGIQMERAKDGVHPNDTGAAKWADAFWTQFAALPAKD